MLYSISNIFVNSFFCLYFANMNIEKLKELIEALEGELFAENQDHEYIGNLCEEGRKQFYLISQENLKHFFKNNTRG